jgi:hypothetical protein
MKTVSKRELARQASRLNLRPGESLQLDDSPEPLVLYRRKRKRLSADEIHAELDRICAGGPELDAQAILKDLRE